MKNYLYAMRRYATFSGRSSRAEFWLFTLFYLIFGIIPLILDLSLVDPSGEIAPLTGIYVLAHILPSIAVLIRRLHDIDRTGWWFLLYFTGIGIFVLLIFATIGGTDGPNRFGPAPGDTRQKNIKPSFAPTSERLDPPRDLIGELERLSDLKAKGAISEAEYDAMKARALGAGQPA